MERVAIVLTRSVAIGEPIFPQQPRLSAAEISQQQFRSGLTQKPSVQMAF